MSYVCFQPCINVVALQGGGMQRFHDTLSGPAERAILRYLCQRLPMWATSDGLTALGLVGAAVTCLSYWLANHDPAYLWLAIAGLVINWLGDSLDGSLARFRKLERPQYGFFLDHSVDAFAMAFIAIGIGLSPQAQLGCALAVLVAYYLMVILSMATCLATGVFRVSYGGVGPTEIRLVIVLCTLAAILLPTPSFTVAANQFSIYDVTLMVVSAALLVAAAVQTCLTANSLAKIDPPRR